MKSLYVVVLSTALACGCTRVPVPTYTPTYAPIRLAPACARERIRLTIVGDSLARGWGASASKNTFASLVFADVRRRWPKTTMRNLGIPGATTDEIATVEVPHVQKLYTPRHFQVSYAKLLQDVRARVPHGALVVMGLPDVSLAPLIPWILKPFESWPSKDADASIAAAAREYGAAFVPLYAFSHQEAYRWKSLLSRDGIHPNDEGYRVMAATASPTIMSAIR